MAFATIVNLVLVAIIVIFAWQGFKKGIFMGIIEVLVIILSLYGGKILTDTFSHEVVPALQPFVSGYMDSRVEKTAFEALGYEPDANGEYHVSLSLVDLLAENPQIVHSVCVTVYGDLGVYDAAADTLATRTEAYAEENDVTLRTAIVDVLCRSVTWLCGYILFFLLVFIALTVVINLPNLSLRLPYVGLVNDVGGAAIGVFNGFVCCAILLWVVQYGGLVLPEEKLRTASVAAYFLDTNLLSRLIVL